MMVYMLVWGVLVVLALMPMFLILWGKSNDH